ncbi:phosphatases II [Lepidopterella palustris CBS 459.81]|uniref:Phosphatases II n=1 Tax=Lepidopterella palustris CBS 459.81 TaxID=1314670 RepID=A0A8E2JG42_9PEZI|nr:phosphatases II [Lepidopterella palustris CBS 459.81]
MVSHEENAMSDTSLSHKRHQEYVYRLPTPPRIIIPPPTLQTEVPDVAIERVIHPEEGQVDMSFLSGVDFSDVVQRNSLIEWTYERRRQAQMVLPFLYLGPMVAAKDMAFLRNEQITMLLAIRPRQTGMIGAFKAAQDANLETCAIEVPNNQALISTFPNALKIINEHLYRVYKRDARHPQMGKVFVFCESGNEKSAAIVAAYLMEMLADIDFVKAMQICQAQRFCVNFDDALKHLLQSYWEIISARRLVAKTRPSSLPSSSNLSVRHSQPVSTGSSNRSPSVSGHKRTLDDVYDDDMDMDDGVDSSDDARFRGREIAPFEDSR